MIQYDNYQNPIIENEDLIAIRTQYAVILCYNIFNLRQDKHEIQIEKIKNMHSLDIVNIKE